MEPPGRTELALRGFDDGSRPQIPMDWFRRYLSCHHQHVTLSCQLGAVCGRKLDAARASMATHPSERMTQWYRLMIWVCDIISQTRRVLKQVTPSSAKQGVDGFTPPIWI